MNITNVTGGSEIRQIGNVLTLDHHSRDGLRPYKYLDSNLLHVAKDLSWVGNAVISLSLHCLPPMGLLLERMDEWGLRYSAVIRLTDSQTHTCFPLDDNDAGVPYSPFSLFSLPASDCLIRQVLVGSPVTV